MIRPRATFISIAATILAIPAMAGASPQDLEVCEQHLERSSGGEAPALCLYEVATGNGPWRTAASRRLEELVAKYPEDPWLLLYLGKLKRQTHKPDEVQEAAELYLLAAGLAGRRGMAAAEYEARSGLCRILRDAGRLDEAEAEVERAVRVAEFSGSPLLGLRANILRALHLYARGEFEQAFQTLRRIQDAVEAESPYPVLREHLFILAKAAQQTGRFHETRQAYRLAAERATAAGDLDWLAQALYGIAALSRDELTEVPSARGRQQVLELARHALDAAHAAGRTSLETQSLWMLGALGDIGEAESHLERCYQVAATPGERSFCRGTLAKRLAGTDPERAKDALHEALTLAEESGAAPTQVAFWMSRMRVSWTLNPTGIALTDALAALNEIETLRDQQKGGSGQPGLFSTWAEHYYWLSGQLLEADQPERAFGVIERMRSRTLIDALGLSLSGSRASPALHARREDVLLDIARVQRLLLDARLGKKERARARAELDRLELEASALQSQIAKAEPAATRQPGFASLEQVRKALAPDEALLSFQIAPWRDLAGDFGGGSWLLVSTRDTTRVYRLAGRTELRPDVTIFIGMFEARNGSEARSASALYKELLAPALAKLPPGVRRLAIVPDDYLHRLPFAALRPEPDGDPLAVRYEITLAPSATLWLRWRKARPAPTATPPLVLADPVTLATLDDAGEPSNPSDTADERSDKLKPLRYARTEGESVMRHLPGGKLLMGEGATETYIKETYIKETYIKKNAAGRPFGLVHFAAHAVTDEVNPDRSRIYLSPGNDKEDGVLQVREIVELRLGGRIVVLSTCESASGGILRGEGVMGLARAFFQAGAHTVVASLWPLRDDDGAALFDRFYRHLSRGKSVAAALQAAQRDRRDEGAPAEAWAGVVVLGDGDRVPVPGGRRPSLVPWALLLGLLAAALLVRRYRKA
ncbi:MAG TPA: CHAT domain-containing protein [Thermoanaerobaculia bacterium]|nr:CHAT domain-containing protein [Thermoanaerobaculia bacterium]